jgi:general L-amino acid transport system permease protein
VAAAARRPPPWRDVRVLRVLGQVVFLALVFALLAYLLGNLRENLRESGLPTGFGFLDQPTGVDIRDSDFRPSQPVRDALLVGLVNTVRVSLLGIGIATLLGILIGVARLSTNWLVRKSAALYVEAFRNVPVLVWIIFTYTAVMLKLPPITEAVEFLGATVFSNRGLVVPWYERQVSPVALLAAFGGLLAALALVWVWRTRRADATGRPHHRILWVLATLIVVGAALSVLLGPPVALTLPTREGRIVTGGIGLGPEFAAVLVALALYTASHIAEIVRGSILAVPHGQSEAAQAIGLTPFQRMRFVVLPQALRIAVPPMANQYLNLMKNSSLAVAIGYFELTRITFQAIANGNPAPQAISVLMLAYLFLSLVISLFANIVNRRLALDAR